MFGQLDGRTRERIADLLSGLLGQDTDRVLRALDALEIRAEHVDLRAMRRDAAEIVAAYSDLTLDNVDLGTLLKELVGFIRSYNLHIPPDLVLLIRSLVTIEGVGRALDPHFDIAGELYPFIRALTLQRLHPWRLIANSIRTAEDVQRVTMLLPDVLVSSLESIKRGELTVRFDLQHFENLVRQLTRASNTLAIGMLISGLVVASALVLRTGTILVAYGGFAIAGVLLAWLFWNMSRD
jgi:ubiquinone biosynthesis protein